MNSGSPFAASSSQPLPPVITALLLTAVNAESTATGSNRRRQFRNTRRILNALRANGFFATDIAEVLGRSANSIRDRANEEGAISASDFSSLTGVSVSEIVKWETTDQLPQIVTEDDGYVGYPAGALLRAFLAWSRG